eukprot:277921_1
MTVSIENKRQLFMNQQSEAGERENKLTDDVKKNTDGNDQNWCHCYHCDHVVLKKLSDITHTIKCPNCKLLLVIHRELQQQPKLRHIIFPHYKSKTYMTENVNMIQQKVHVKCKISNEIFNSNQHFVQLNNKTKIAINKSLHIMLTLSNEKRNHFGQDLLPLLYDDFSRFNVISEINHIIQNSESLAQLYWVDDDKHINKIVFREYDTDALIEQYKQIDIKHEKILKINNVKIAYENKTISENDLLQICTNDYKSMQFQFLSKNQFYTSLQHEIINKNPNIFFKDITTALQNYEKLLCPRLSFVNSSYRKINDNIFVYWMYIECMSSVIKQYI